MLGMDEDMYLFAQKVFEEFLKKKLMQIKIHLANELDTSDYIFMSEPISK